MDHSLDIWKRHVRQTLDFFWAQNTAYCKNRRTPTGYTTTRLEFSASPVRRSLCPGATRTQITTMLSSVAPKQTVLIGPASGIAAPETAATVATAPTPGLIDHADLKLKIV
ncbi:MAG: hypothetical protein ABI164_01695 [Acidobacteriaceae bacterium]